MATSTHLTAALEDYLEAIFHVVAEKGEARVNDIAAELSVHKSTVTAALKRLARERMVNYSPYESATLTARGRREARRVTRRHRVIRDFLTDVLAVAPKSADENACRMEHVVDKDVLDRLARFAQFVKDCPRAGEGWVGSFRAYCDHGGQLPADASKARRWLKSFDERIGAIFRDGRNEQAASSATSDGDRGNSGRGGT